MSKNKLWDKFDKSLGTVIVYAEAASIDGGVDCLYPESLAIGILTTGANEVNSILVKIDVDLEQCLKSFKKELIKRQKNNECETLPSNLDTRVSRQVVEICKVAAKISKSSKSEKIGIYHLFLALLEVSKNAKSIFDKNGFDSKEFKNAKKSPVYSDGETEQTNKKKDKKSALSSFCTNITEQAGNNELDPILAREKEIEAAITILCRRGKNNPILLGEPGVGKTAIVEGIAQRIISKTVPKQLIGCKLFSLSLSSLVAGTKYRGEFEDRIQNLITEVRNTDNCILFIDEIHTLVGAGSSSGALDASNILKPFLARSELRCIGATTLDDFKAHFQKDGALTRRFQQILVEEPSKQQMYKILLGIKSKYEKYHKCTISDGAIDAMIELTNRYLADKNFPDKAIDCMDMTCAKYVAWDDKKKDIIITEENVATIISEQCKIPLEVILWNDNERINKIKALLSQNVIGQTSAIDSVCSVLKNAYSGIRNPNRPIGSFVFGGQSGTGKTYMAKQLGVAAFGKESALIRLDMSEYSESHSISKLIGSPPGYVGFRESEVFIDKIQRKPYSIVLLDEMEKANPSVLKLFLQVMSDGIMTNAIGNQVDFKNVILIMTGNFGTGVKSKIGSLGFGKDVGNEHKTAFESEKQSIVDFCKKMYGAEFINRVDEFVPFMPLDNDSLKKIAHIEIEKVAKRLINRKRKLLFSDRVYDALIAMQKGEYGSNATVLNRLITKKIEPCISDALLSIDDNKFYTITIDAKKGKFTYRKKTNE